MQIQTSAPGKLVLSGEYVVLQGAPALVLALNSRAKCTFEANEAKGWQIHSLPSNHTEIVEMSSRSIDTTLGSLHELIDFMQPLDRVPENAKLKLDTSDFFEHQHKLGLGSSAALVVALGALIDSLRDTHTPFETLRRIHNQMQKSCGSGLDVAASLVGGAIKFQEGQYHSVSLPDGLCFCFVFAGTSTNTTEMVQRFSKILTETHDQGIVAAWRQSASETGELAQTSYGLPACSERVG